MTEFLVQNNDRLLMHHGITVSGQWDGSSNRYWRAVGRLDHQPVFLKAANRPELRRMLRREIAIAREVHAAGVPTTVPLLDLDLGDLVVAVFQFEPRAAWQSDSEVNATQLGHSHAVAVAETLARLVRLPQEQVPSVPWGPSSPGTAVEQFVSWVNDALDSRTYDTSLAERKGTLREYLEQVRGLPISTTVHQLASELSTQTDCTTHLFVHGDACPANTAFLDNNVAAFFDFEWSRVEPARHIWFGIDIMNYVTRSWANLEFSRDLLTMFAKDVELGRCENLALRAAVIMQTLNKLGPSYTYPEPKWQATQARFETLLRMLSYALEHGDDFAAMTAV